MAESLRPDDNKGPCHLHFKTATFDDKKESLQSPTPQLFWFLTDWKMHFSSKRAGPHPDRKVDFYLVTS
jgi:hypothetical protein